MRVVYRESELLERGLTALDIPPSIDMPGIGRLMQIHHENNVALGGIHSFRTAVGWKYYRLPDAVEGYVETPLLP